MTSHLFDNDFRLTPDQQSQYKQNGFVKLEGFLNDNAVEMLRDRVDVELSRKTGDHFKAGSLFSFNRAEYDFVSDKEDILQLIERPYLQQALTGLTGRDIFLTFEIAFEVEKNVSKGLPWHVGIQSFGYQSTEEFGCSVWMPLHPIDPDGQRGGVACVSRSILSGEFAYSIDAALVDVLKARERAGKRTSVKEYFNLREIALNSPLMDELFALHCVEYDFSPGDALLFDKTVIHRSIMLEEGGLSHRAAYVLRFVDAASRYDMQKAKVLEYPVEQYGGGFLGYKPLTRQHIEIAEAGAKNGDLLAECAYFDNPERRIVSRAKS